MIADRAWRPTLLRKGKDVADLLEAVLAGKEVDLVSLPVPVSPSQDPELRLRSFLEQIDRAIKAFDTDRFGRCELCGVDLDAAVLKEQPWLAACPAHAGRGFLVSRHEAGAREGDISRHACFAPASSPACSSSFLI